MKKDSKPVAKAAKPKAPKPVAAPIEKPPRKPVEQPQPEGDWTTVHSNGRTVHWRKCGDLYLVHCGDESQARTMEWAQAQTYLDGGGSLS
jgi:hypothetical protein